MEKKATVSDAELEILEVLWSADCALNANEIRSTLDKVKHWERTTVLTLIQRLQKKRCHLSGKTRSLLLHTLY